MLPLGPEALATELALEINQLSFALKILTAIFGALTRELSILPPNLVMMDFFPTLSLQLVDLLNWQLSVENTVDSQTPLSILSIPYPPTNFDTHKFWI